MTMMIKRNSYSELANSDEIDVEVLPGLQIRQQLLQIGLRHTAQDIGIINEIGIRRRPLIEDIKLGSRGRSNN